MNSKDKKLSIEELESKLAKRSAPVLHEHDESELIDDSDGDTLSDYTELHISNTNPFNPDSDFDGVKDDIDFENKKNFWKDQFIPHKGNKFKPHFIRPKKIFWHIVFAIALKVASLALIFALPLSAWLTPDILVTQSQKIVEMTNTIRAELSLSPLKVSPQLTKSANMKSEDMSSKSYFAHINSEGKRLRDWIKDVGYLYTVTGENLAVGFSSSEGVMNGWRKSKTHYSNIIDPLFTEIGVGITTGKYQDVDTTFVTQHFGMPKEVVKKSQTISAKKPKIKLNEVAKQSASAKVLGQRDDEANCDSFDKPTIISPQVGDQIFTNKSLARVYAPSSQKVILFSGDDVLSQSVSNGEDPYYILPFELEEGINSLEVMSWCGNEYIYSQPVKVFADTTPPLIDEKNSTLSAKVDDNGSYIISGDVITSIDSKEVDVYINEFQMHLVPNEKNYNQWTGQAVIFNDPLKPLFAPLVLATVRSTDAGGNTTIQDISWKDIGAIKPSLKEEYEYIKKNQSAYVKGIFGLSLGYYHALVVIMAMALIINIFVEIKKQYLPAIISTICLIGLLIVLIKI